MNIWGIVLTSRLCLVSIRGHSHCIRCGYHALKKSDQYEGHRAQANPVPGNQIRLPGFQFLLLIFLFRDFSVFFSMMFYS